MTIQYLTHAYDQLDEQSTPVLRGVWEFERVAARIPAADHLRGGSDVFPEGGNRQRKHISQSCSQQKARNFRV